MYFLSFHNKTLKRKIQSLKTTKVWCPKDIGVSLFPSLYRPQRTKTGTGKIEMSALLVSFGSDSLSLSLSLPLRGRLYISPPRRSVVPWHCSHSACHREDASTVCHWATILYSHTYHNSTKLTTGLLPIFSVPSLFFMLLGEWLLATIRFGIQCFSENQ